MTPEQLRELRDQLPPFPGSGPPSSLQSEFCRFYGIDFHDRLPGLDYRVGTVVSGDYTLAVGLYEADTLQRLPVQTDQYPIVDNAVRLIDLPVTAD